MWTRKTGFSVTSSGGCGYGNKFDYRASILVVILVGWLSSVAVVSIRNTCGVEFQFDYKSQSKLFYD